MFLSHFLIALIIPNKRKQYANYVREHKVRIVSDPIIKRILEENYGAISTHPRTGIGNEREWRWNGIEFKKNSLLEQPEQVEQGNSINNKLCVYSDNVKNPVPAVPPVPEEEKSVVQEEDIFVGTTGTSGTRKFYK